MSDTFDNMLPSWNEDPVWENTLRPTQLNDFVGQQRIRANISIYVQAALGRGDALDHILFHGPPGLGKTTLANIIAAELDVPMSAASGPALERPKDLAAILSRLEPRSVLFIDEIHRLPTSVEEILYPAMEDFQLDIIVGEGPTARSIKLALPPFTLVGATTRASLLSKPLRDRFGIREKLEYYDIGDLADILEANARKLSIELARDLLHRLAQRSRGTPRVAIQLLKRVRDFLEVEGRVDSEPALEKMLDRIGVDSRGLLPGDIEYLSVLALKFQGGPTGLNTLAAALGEDKDTLESYVEPYLIREGMIDRTPKGRCLTSGAYKHLGMVVPASDSRQSSLFGTDGGVL